jgi:Peptidase_C39 like family
VGRVFKWMIGLTFVGALAVSGGLAYVVWAGQNANYVSPDVVPIADSPTTSPSTNPASPIPSPSPAVLPAAVLLKVPFTSQAPLNDWAAKQHTCEEASLVMVDRYLRGDHSGALIDPQTANNAINRITPWKVTEDLTDVQFGKMAQLHMGWAYKVLPATRQNIKQQLALGRPVIVGVRTHGLGNPNYPGYRTHYEQAGWSVSHYIVVVGYDQSDTVILNDPGLTRGHGYHIKFDQLFHAITDLDNAYPNLNQGLVILVLAPAAH